jgi:hypothetical protein
MVINEAFGCVENLPFDLRFRRVLKYNLNQDDKNDPLKTRICKEETVNNLKNAINDIVSRSIPQSLKEDLRLVDDKVKRTRIRFENAIKCAIEKIELNLVLPSFINQFQSIQDEYDKFFFVFDGQNYFWYVNDTIKLIEYARRITLLLDSFTINPEIKNQLLATVKYDNLLIGEKVEIAGVVTPLIELEAPSILDIYFRILTIFDSRASFWKETFENEFLGGFEELAVADEINEKQNYIEHLEKIRSEILDKSFKEMIIK